MKKTTAALTIDELVGRLWEYGKSLWAEMSPEDRDFYSSEGAYLSGFVDGYMRGRVERMIEIEKELAASYT